MLPGNTYTIEMVRALKTYGNITLMCSEKSHIKEENVKVVSVFYTGGKRKVAAVYAYLKGLVVFIKELLFGSYDILHIETFKSYKSEIPLILIFKKKSTELVCTVHNVLPRESKNDVFNDSGRKLSRFYHNCNKLIVHNEISKRALMDFFGVNEGKIRVVPHGTYHADAENVCYPHNEVAFLTFGAIREYKGIDLLLDAIRIIPENKRIKMHFYIAGGQNRELDPTDYVKLVEEYKLERFVTLEIRRVKDEEVSILFGKADACIFPYRQIWGSGALLMAYTYNKPVIASDVDAFIEETNNGGTGLLFKKNSAESLSEAIIKFANLSGDEIKQYKMNIRELVESKYNWEISAKKTYNVYKECKIKNEH